MEQDRRDEERRVHEQVMHASVHDVVIFDTAQRVPYGNLAFYLGVYPALTTNF